MTRSELITAIKTAAVVALVGIMFAVGVKLLQGKLCGEGWCQFWPSLSVDEVTKLIRDSGSLGVLVSMGLMIAHSFIPFPSELLTMANGMIYGPLWGTVVSWTGAMMGALVAYALAKWLGSGFVLRMLGTKKSQNMDKWLAVNGPGALLVSRLIPVVSFNLINYASGLARVPLWTFIWTTAIGILPVTILVSVMGANVADLVWWHWALLLSGGLMVWAITRMKSKRH